MSDELRRSIEEAFNLRIINEQYYAWGESYWLELDPNARKPQRTVSIVNIFPNTEQKVHTHSGYEEIIFGVDGESIHLCNGRRIVLAKGKVGYIPGGGEHGMLNTSGQVARMMSIVYPTLPVELGELSAIDDINLREVSQLVNLEAISDKFAGSVRLAVALVDAAGKLLAEPKNFPDFCRRCMQLGGGDCVLSGAGGRSDGDKNLAISRCGFGVHSIKSPIIINDRLLGYLGCGYGLVVPPTADDEAALAERFAAPELPPALKAYRELGVINHNHLQAVAETLSLVSASLVQMIIHSARDKEISAYKLSLVQEKQRQAELENALNEAKLKLLESQVNPHFLFNTLNTIAQLSLMEGAETAASLTYALSNMLRQSLGKQENLVTVADELALVKDYLLIQQTRFPDRFTVGFDFAPAIMAVRIPFMTLLILVENAIQHGFENIRWPGRLEIKGYRAGRQVVLEVVDNGAGISPAVIDSLKSLGHSGSDVTAHDGIGLKNIHRRLEHYYGEQAALVLSKLPDAGTKAIVRIPT